MKKVLFFIAATSMIFLAASCNKNKEEFPEKQMTLTEQAQYLSEAGLEVLDQIQIPDFQKIAFAIEDNQRYFGKGNLSADSLSFSNVMNYYANEFKTDNNYWLLRPQDINTQIVITRNARGDTIHKTPWGAYFAVAQSGGINVSFPDHIGQQRSASYSMNLRITDSDKLICCANTNDTKAAPVANDIWMYAPSTATLDVNIDGNTYARIDLPRTDWSSFPEDVKSITKNVQSALAEEDTITAFAAALPLLNFAVGADIYLNGTDSYRLHIENISVHNEVASGSLPVEMDFTLYGKDGIYSLLSGYVKADVYGILFAKASKDTITTKDMLDAIITAKVTAANGKVRAEWIDNNGSENNNFVNIYIGTSNPQMWFNAYALADKSQKAPVYTADAQNPTTTWSQIYDKTQVDLYAVIAKGRTMYNQLVKMFKRPTNY